MLISTIQGQTLTPPIAVESALLELLEIGANAVTENSTAQISTDYSNETLTASVTLPIAQQARPDGSVIILALDNSIPEPSVD